MTGGTSCRPPRRDHGDDTGAAQLDAWSGEAAGRPSEAPQLAELQWHLAEVAAMLRRGRVPLSPELLVVALHGMADLCRLLYERRNETGAAPPSLFRDDPVVAEALAMWAARVRAATAAQRQPTTPTNGDGGSPQ